MKLKITAGETIAGFIDTIPSEKYWSRPYLRGVHHMGRRHQRERIESCAEWAAQNYDGDFIEIGAMHGKTTLVLAKIARKYNRKVIVIDPWSTPKEAFDGDLKYLEGNEYEIFCENTKDYSDVIEVNRVSSHDPSLPEILKQRELCFAWVDGSHTEVALKNDLNLVKHCQGVIGVDDIGYRMFCDVCCHSEGYNLFEHFNEFCSQNSFQKIKLDWNAEGYIFCGYKDPLLTPDFLGSRAEELIGPIKFLSSISIVNLIYVGDLENGPQGPLPPTGPLTARFVWLTPTNTTDTSGHIRVGGQTMPGHRLHITQDFINRLGPPESECSGEEE